MNKKFRLSLIMVLALILLAACGGSDDSSSSEEGKDNASSDEKIVLKLATHEPPGAFFSSTVTEPFMDRVVELTDGQVEFEFYPSQQIGQLADFLDLTANGVVDIAFNIPSYHTDRMPYTGTINAIPGLVNSSNQGSKAFHELIQTSPVLETDFLNNGVRPIMGYTTSSYDFWSASTLIKSPEDLKGKQIRSSGGLMSDVLEFFGAAPVTIPTTEMYESLERGIIDALAMYPVTLDSFGIGEIIKYGAQGINFGAGPTTFIMNEEKWQSLPSNVQEAIQQAMDEVSDSGSKADDDARQGIVDEWSKSAEIYNLTEEEQAEWNAKFDEFYEQWISEQTPEMAEVIEKYRELLEKHK